MLLNWCVSCVGRGGVYCIGGASCVDEGGGAVRWGIGAVFKGSASVGRASGCMLGFFSCRCGCCLGDTDVAACMLCVVHGGGGGDSGVVIGGESGVAVCVAGWLLHGEGVLCVCRTLAKALCRLRSFGGQLIWLASRPSQVGSQLNWMDDVLAWTILLRARCAMPIE